MVVVPIVLFTNTVVGSSLLTYTECNYVLDGLELYSSFLYVFLGWRLLFYYFLSLVNKTYTSLFYLFIFHLLEQHFSCSFVILQLIYVTGCIFLLLLSVSSPISCFMRRCLRLSAKM